MMRKIMILGFIFAGICDSVYGLTVKNSAINSTGELRVRELYDNIFATLSSGHYDKRIRPYVGVRPLGVTIFIRVLSLRSISEATMDYKLELFFREMWTEPRLSYDPTEYDNITEINLHESLIQQLWMPDTYLPNAVKSKNPSSESVTHRALLRLRPDGRILYSRRLSIQAECPMDLMLYPFDQQICVLSIESYGFGTDELMYKWRRSNPVVLDTDLKLPDFEIKKVLTKVRNVTVETAITFLYYSYTTMMPTVSYVKAMDVYLGGCFLYVFAAMAKMAACKAAEHIASEQEAAEEGAHSKHEESPGDTKSPELPDNALVNFHNLALPDDQFQYCPTPSAADVFQKIEKPQTEQKPKNLLCKKLDACAFFTKAKAMVLHLTVLVPIATLPISFIVFCFCYFCYTLLIAVDTNESKCNF